MKVQEIKIDIFTQQPNPNPICDALQALPGSGSVHVTVTTEDGVSGVGDVGFGRIAGAPQALGALIEHELKPLVLNQDLGYIRAIHQEMLRETEYHGSSGLAMFGIAAVDTALWDCLGKTWGFLVGNCGDGSISAFGPMRWSAG